MPPKATTLYAIELPLSGGGNTEFTNMMMSYDALDYPLKESLRGLQPMVRQHTKTGRAELYRNPICCDAVEGVGEAEGDTQLDVLYRHCVRSEFLYSHRWSKDYMLIWDNRLCLYQADPVRTPSERR